MTDSKTYLLTGAAGFIGSNLAHYLVSLGYKAVVLDKLTYAGNMASLDGLPSGKFLFVHGDICDADAVFAMLEETRPDGIFHLAAESHVDRSIDGPGEFINTNINGTFSMLSAARRYYESLQNSSAIASPLLHNCFRFLHISTVEVYDSLGESGYFTEETHNSPSSANIQSSSLFTKLC